MFITKNYTDKVQSTPSIELELKYGENWGIKDLGEPSVRPIVRGRQKEIESRVKHM